MPYLVCEKCKGYYALQVGESPKDFGKCQCGGSLRYVKKLNKRYNRKKSLNNLNICPKCGKQNIKTSKMCVFCGKILKSSNGPNICHNCGKENVKTSKVCVFCSNPLKSNFNSNKQIRWAPIAYSALILVTLSIVILYLTKIIA
jgi:predicted amidophosphoribosyltransferase